MAEQEKTRYSSSELKEFEDLLLQKMEVAKKELEIYRNAVSLKDSEGTDDTTGTNFSLDSGAESMQKEELNELAARQSKYVKNLENALVRIKNGTYGVCTKTGKLIPKARLLLVPHTTLSIEGKMMQDKSR